MAHHWFCLSVCHRLFCTLQVFGGIYCSAYKPALVIIPEKQIIDMMFPVHGWLSRPLFYQGPSSPVPHQLSVRYLVQILRGWKIRTEQIQPRWGSSQSLQCGALLQRSEAWTRDWNLKVTTEIILVLFFQQKLPKGPKQFLFLPWCQKHQFISTQDSNSAAVPSITSTMQLVIANPKNLQHTVKWKQNTIHWMAGYLCEDLRKPYSNSSGFVWQI